MRRKEKERRIHERKWNGRRKVISVSLGGTDFQFSEAWFREETQL